MGGAFPTVRVTAAVAAVAVVATALIAVVEPLRFAYEGRDERVAMLTAVAFVGVLAAGLVLARFARTHMLRDLALFAALAVLALANLAFGSVPAAFGGADTNFGAWAPLVGRLAGAVLLAASVAVPDRLIGRPRRAMTYVAGGSVALVALLGGLVAELAPGWSSPVPAGLTPADSGTPDFARPAATALELVICTLYAIAAVGFVVRARRDPTDPLIGSVALAAPLGAAAALNYALFPSLHAGWIYTGDAFRAGFYAMLLVGAVRELIRWQAQLAEMAVADERRRIARDLHDGLAQELAFIVGQTRNLADMSAASGVFENLLAAAERALDESRTAIAALTRPADEPLDVALAQAAEDVAARVGARMRFDLARDVQVAPDVREDLMRIVREAVTNAARHGRASTVSLSLGDRDGVRVRIADDGEGFDPDSPRNHGFGLTSMRERAEAHGGRLRIESRPGGGTEVEVVIP